MQGTILSLWCTRLLVDNVGQLQLSLESSDDNGGDGDVTICRWYGYTCNTWISACMWHAGMWLCMEIGRCRTWAWACLLRPQGHHLLAGASRNHALPLLYWILPLYYIQCVMVGRIGTPTALPACKCIPSQDTPNQHRVHFQRSIYLLKWTRHTFFVAKNTLRTRRGLV